MAGRKGRANFSPATRETIAKRAAYTCSFPKCGRRTIGPADDQTKFSDTGIAAHIYGAARSGKGPRGTERLTDEELRSPTNGIWLCAHHAALIDKHDGSDYPASVLHAYKALHETRVAHEVAGIHTPVCWVTRVIVESSPIFRGPVDIPFAKLNLLVGDNGVGKTGLCEWIAGTSDSKYFTRWWPVHHPGYDPVTIKVHYASPDPHVMQVQLRAEDSAAYRLDDEATVAAAGRVKVVFPMWTRHPPAEGIDDLRDLAQDLDLHRHEVRALCESLDRAKQGFFYDGRFQMDGDSRSLLVRTVGVTDIGALPYGGLSGSEQQRLKMQLAVEAANQLSTVAPTLLVLDEGLSLLDTGWLRTYAEELASPSCRFQTIACMVHRNVDLDDVTWAGWRVVRFDGVAPHVVVDAGG